jgi:hypothetical protein
MDVSGLLHVEHLGRIFAVVRLDRPRHRIRLHKAQKLDPAEECSRESSSGHRTLPHQAGLTTAAYYWARLAAADKHTVPRAALAEVSKLDTSENVLHVQKSDEKK